MLLVALTTVVLASNIKTSHLRHTSELKSYVDSLYDLTAVSIEGETVDLSALKGSVSLVVNVATH